MKKFTPLLFVILFILLLVFILRPRWYLNLTKQVEVSPAVGAALVEKYDCRSCHIIGEEGAYIGPNLNDAVKSESEEMLYRWLANPRGAKSNTAMPNFHLSDSEIHAIIAYLKSVQ